MSHFSNHHLKPKGIRIGHQHEWTHQLKQCWGCGAEILVNPRQRGIVKLCQDCKEKFTTEEIKTIYRNHYRHISDQKRAKRSIIRPCDEKHIYNSPFRGSK